LLQRFFLELKRRHVYRVAVAYLVAAFVVVQVADLLAGAFGLPSWFEPMVWVLGALGLPIALVLAWAYDVGPDGIRRTPDADRGEPIAGLRGGPPERTGFGRRALIGVGILVVVATGGWYLLAAGEPEVTNRSIAVLPFEATGGEESLEFSAGLHDDLLTRLTNVAALTVKSRTSAQRYQGTDKSIPEIASELDVGWIVEGAVHRSGDRIRVNATLIDARSDARRWARDYDREVTVEDVFDIQSDLARMIAQSLQAELSAREAARLDLRPTDDLEAYRLYIQGRSSLDRRTEVGMRSAADDFERAIERDSAYALAWSGLADARGLLALYGYGPADSLRPLALDDARRAVALDPELAEARVSLGQLYDDYLRDRASAIREMRRAVELKPSYAQGYLWLAELEGGRGRQEEALEHARRAAELDPRSPVVHVVLAWVYWWIDGPEPDALAQMRLAKELEPSFVVAQSDEGMLLGDAGRTAEGIAALERGLAMSVDGSLERGVSLAGLGVVFADAGEPDRAREMLARLREEGGMSFWESLVLAALGDTEAAFEALDEVEWTSVYVWDLLVLPGFAPLRDDPRYEALVRANNRRWGLNPDGSLPEEG